MKRILVIDDEETVADIGGSAAMRQVLELVELAARCDANVLIAGERGAGKELWNKDAAARLLGLYRPTLYSRMRRHGIPLRRPG